MALNLDSLLLQLRPGSGLDLSGMMRGIQQGQQMGMERQQLALERQKFEETRRRNLEDEKLRRLAEAGERRRAEMAAEQAKAKLAADAEAKRLESATGAYNDFFKATDARDFSGMDTAASRLREYGGVGEQLGVDEQGRPKYRVGLNAAQRAEQVGERDAVTKETQTQAPEGSVWLPQDVANQRTLDRLRALKLDDLDSQGFVDAGELIDQSRQQLGPVMESFRQGLPPGAYRDSAEAVDRGVTQVGMGPAASLKLRDEMQAKPFAAIKGELDAERDIAKEERMAERAMSKEERDAARDAAKHGDTLSKQGFDNAEKKWKSEGLAEVVKNSKTADQLVDMLESPNKFKASHVAHMFLKLKGSLGAQSNAEMDEVFGTKDMSWPEKAVEFFRAGLLGGKNPEMKETILEIVQRGMETDNERVFSYLDTVDNVLADPNATEEDKRGWRRFRSTVPQKYRDAHDEFKKDSGEPVYQETPSEEKPQGASATPIRFNMEEDAAKNGAPGEEPEYHGKASTKKLEGDPEFMTALSGAAEKFGVVVNKMLPLLSSESRGNPQAANTTTAEVNGRTVRSSARGLVQMINSVATQYTNPRTGEKFKNSDEFGQLSAVEQAPIVAEYFHDKFAQAGVDPATASIADYALAVAAPAFVGKSGDRDTVVYKKGSDDHAINRPWWPKGGGDITVGSILDFYLGRGSESAEPGPVGSSSAQPGPRAARERAKQGAEEKPAASKPGANDHELDEVE